MGPRAKLKAALARVAELKSIDGDLSPEQIDEVTKLADDVKSLRETIAKMDEAADKLKGIAEAGDTDEDAEPSDDESQAGSSKNAPARTRPREEGNLAKSFGEKFLKSDRYQAFVKAYPSGVGSGSPVDIGRVKVGSMSDYFARRKAGLLGSDLGHVAPVRMPTVDQVDRARLTLLDLITRGQTAGNFEYVQITGVTRNAAIVPEATSGTDAAALKPISEMETELADAKVYTYADGYDVTNQLLSDAPAFATYMNSELSFGLDNCIEEKLLNGTGVSGEPTGILNTTGVQEVTYAGGEGIAEEISPAAAMAFIKAVRRGITRITRLPGGVVDAVVLSPEMDEAIDLLQDANDRFYGAGPFSAGPTTLWGRPRVTSERLVLSQALLGDFRQVALLDREGLSVLAFNQHKDYAQRNMVYVRGELRAAQVIWKPNRLAVVTPAPAV
jgi:HK97 family phage major capsid protein